MASITPVVAVQETIQATSSETYVDCACETAALANGVEYLVIYRANSSNSSTFRHSDIQLLMGATQVAEAGGEGFFRDTQAYGGKVLQGFCKVTGNGTATLKFQHRINWDTETSWIDAQSIIAIPLTELASDDWYYSGVDAATLQLTDATFGAWQTVRTANFALTATSEDWLVLASVEGKPDSASGVDGCRTRFRVGGATVGSEYWYTAEDVVDWQGIAFAKVEAALSGTTAFAIEGRSAGITNLADYRRPRIFAIRKDAFDQMVSAVDTTGSITSSTTYVDFTALDTTYTPNQTEHVVALSFGVYIADPSGGDTTVLQRLYNSTDATVFVDDAGTTGPGDDIGLDSDQQMLVLSATEQLAAAKTYKLQHRMITGGTSSAIGKGNTVDSGAASSQPGIYSGLIVWGLTTPAGGVPVGTSLETDTALALSAVKSAVVGLSLETDTALALALATGVEIPVGLSLETDTSLALVAEKRGAVGAALEADTALAQAAVKRASPGASLETDAALSLSAAKRAATGAALETDTSLALDGAKRAAAGLGIETDAALALAAVKSAAPGIALEADLSTALAVTKRGAVGAALETDTALALDAAGVTQLPVGLSTETDVAMARGWFSPLATEADTALGLAGLKRVPAGLSLETDTGLALAARRSIAVELAAEVDVALALVAEKRGAVGVGTETDTAFAPGGQVVAVGLSLEADTALALTAAVPRPARPPGVPLFVIEATAQRFVVDSEDDPRFIVEAPPPAS